MGVDYPERCASHNKELMQRFHAAISAPNADVHPFEKYLATIAARHATYKNSWHLMLSELEKLKKVSESTAL